MKAPLLTEQLDQERIPIFIADPDGIIAGYMAPPLSEEFLPVILTRRSRVKQESPRSIIIPYRSRMPKIPDNNFTCIYFVQSVDEFSGDLFRGLLNEARRRSIPFYFVGAVRHYAKKTVSQVTAFDQGKVFLYGDFVDDPFLTNPAWNVISHAKEEQEVVILGQGLQRILPVSRRFVIDSVLRYSVIEKSEHRCIVLVPRGEIYELSLARILQQLNPRLNIRFSSQKRAARPVPDLPEDSIIISESDTSLKDALRQELAASREKHVVKKSQAPARHPGSRFVRLFLFSVALFIVLLLFLTGGMAFFGERLLVRSVGFITDLRFSEAKQQAELAKSAFVVSSSSLGILKPGAKIFLTESLLLSLEKKLETGEEGASLLGEVAESASVYQKLLTGKEAVDKQQLFRATQQIKNSLLTLSQLSAEGALPSEYGKGLSENRKSIDLFLATAEIIPELLGFGTEKKYLLLFQNNNELRPGGGFIGSFAVVRVKDGKFGELHVQDVYDADGQLKGHVEPPYALKKYLGVNHWYLRDSNFSPDFPESSANAAFFLNLETGEKVDGVIAIDTSVLEGLLRVLGPLRLPGSQDEVTAENVVELTQEGAEKDFFPGSTQKKDFLNELYAAIRMRVAQKGDLFFLHAINAGLVQKHILISFANPKLSFPFQLQGVSSTLETYKKTSDGITGFFGVNEANVGVNKVNKYIERSFLYDVVVTEAGEVKTQVTETLDNKSKIDTPYGGDYRTYIRLLLPENVSPEEIVIDGVKQVVLAPVESQVSQDARGAVPANTLEVERIDITGKATYGFFLTVPVQSKKTIVVKYNEPQSAGTVLGKYSLTLFKQPGTGPDPYALSLSLPSSYSLLSSSVVMKKEGGRYVFLSRLNTDQQIDLSYGKK